MAKLKENEEQKNALEKVNMNIRYIDSLQKGLCNPVINIEVDKKIKSLALEETMRTFVINSFIKSLKKDVKRLCKKFSFELEEEDFKILNCDSSKEQPNEIESQGEVNTEEV